ncbi:MAG: hypothetical protein QXE32_00695 [Sulfolobales archaeon]
MYIRASIESCGRYGEPFWWSSAIVSFERCPKKSFLFDLVIYYYTRDPVSLLLTARKIDSGIKYSSEPEARAPHIIVSVGSSSIESALHELVVNKSYYVKREIESMYKEEEKSDQPQKGFGRILRRPVLTRPRKEIQEEILNSLFSEMIKSLCIEDKTVRPRIMSYTPVSFLAVIDFQNKYFYECFGKKLIRSRSHERYVFEYKEILDMLLENLKLWKGGLNRDL